MSNATMNQQKYKVSEETTALLDAVQSLNNSYKDALKAFCLCYCEEVMEEMTKDYNEAFEALSNALMRHVQELALRNLWWAHNEI